MREETALFGVNSAMSHKGTALARLKSGIALIQRSKLQPSSVSCCALKHRGVVNISQHYRVGPLDMPEHHNTLRRGK